MQEVYTVKSYNLYKSVSLLMYSAVKNIQYFLSPK